MSEARRTILISGGGIAGLAAALCLSREGWRVDLFEQAEGFEAVGAGLQIPPNALRILSELGLDKQLAAVATGPSAIRVMSAGDGGELSRIPVGETTLERYGARYLVAHRADLQQVMAVAANQDPDIALHMGARLEDGVSHANGATCLAYTTGRIQEFTGAALIGADGVWSGLRALHFQGGDAVFSGYVAWRGLIPADRLPGSQDLENVQLWLAPNAHAVTYPVRGGRYLNLVAVTPHDSRKEGMPGRGWAHEADAAELKAKLAGWDCPVIDLLGFQTRWTKWPLFAAPRMEKWSAGNIALVGDAAHAMLPFAAQGAAMAIEDGAVLARCLRPALAGSAGVAECLERYSRLRQPRVARAVRLAETNRTIYHLPAPLARFRNGAMRLLGGRRLLARQDWLYEWNADQP